MRYKKKPFDEKGFSDPEMLVPALVPGATLFHILKLREPYEKIARKVKGIFEKTPDQTWEFGTPSMSPSYVRGLVAEGCA